MITFLRPRPTFSQVVPVMADFRPGGSLRFGVASRAQHRFVSALRPASVCLSCPRVYGIGVYYGINNIELNNGTIGVNLFSIKVPMLASQLTAKIFSSENYTLINKDK